MGFWARLLGMERSASPTPASMIGFSPDGGTMPWGVTASTSLGLSAVWRSIDILSNGVSQLYWREMRGNLELPPSRIVLRPQEDRTRREWTSLLVGTLALYDVAYLLRAAGEDSEGVPISLVILPPDLVQPAYDPTDPYGILPPAEYLIGTTRVPRYRLIVLRRSPQPGLGETMSGILNLARITFASAIGAENYASRFWQAGGPPTTVLETDGVLRTITPQDIQERWRESRLRGPDYPAVLEGGLKARNFGADPTAQAAVEARREQVADIGRYFGIPTAILNAPAGDTETYATTEAQGIHLVNYTLKNYIGAIEDAISDQLPGGRRMQMDTWPLIAGSQLSQAQSYQLATGGKAWISPDEVRERLGLPPIESPDELNPAPVAPVVVGGPNG